MTDQPTVSSPTELCAWDEAFRRVESYLRAHGVESRMQLNRLATDIITVAQRSAMARPDADPVTLAMQETDERIGAWFGRVFGAEQGGNERFHARGRLALIMTDMAGRWSQHFLSEDPVPNEWVAAMAASGVRAGPEVRFTNMAPRPIELAPPPTSGAPPHGLGRGPLLRAAATWFVIIGLLGVTWAASH